MADFCQQCSINMFGTDSRDLAIGDDSRVDRDPVAKPGDRHAVLCEGCYLPHSVMTIVDMNGKCVAACNEHHGAETFESVQGAQAS